MVNQFGVRIRQLREQQNLLLRQVAPLLKMDTPMLSKIERGERRVKREQITVLSEVLKADKNELLTLWLADQIYDVVKNEKLANEAIQIAVKNFKEKNKTKK